MLGDGAEVETWAVESAQAPPVAETLVGGHGSPLHAFSESSLAQDRGKTPDGAVTARVRAGAAAMESVQVAAEAMAADLVPDQEAIAATADAAPHPRRLVDWSKRFLYEQLLLSHAVRAPRLCICSSDDDAPGWFVTDGPCSNYRQLSWCAAACVQPVV